MYIDNALPTVVHQWDQRESEHSKLCKRLSNSSTGTTTSSATDHSGLCLYRQPKASLPWKFSSMNEKVERYSLMSSTRSSNSVRPPHVLVFRLIKSHLLICNSFVQHWYRQVPSSLLLKSDLHFPEWQHRSSLSSSTSDLDSPIFCSLSSDGPRSSPIAMSRMFPQICARCGSRATILEAGMSKACAPP